MNRKNENPEKNSRVTVKNPGVEYYFWEVFYLFWEVFYLPNKIVKKTTSKIRTFISDILTK